MKTVNKIFAFHLLNDRSGSPKVLSQLLQTWVKSGVEVHLYTSAHAHGFLSDLPGVIRHNGWYQFQQNPWLRLIYFTWSQCLLIFNMWNKIKKDDILYVNTVLPFGAAILGKIKGARVIYHIHESTVNPAILKWFLFKIVGWSASNIVNVSKFVQDAHGIKNLPNALIYNSIDDTYLKAVQPKMHETIDKNVLMVCSLKTYKGVHEFVRLANENKNFSFRLVLNATEAEVADFFSGQDLPSNLTLFSSQNNLHTFYAWADVIVNLSRPDGWVETFGLTIIEGMAYGLPAVVPPVGGILEVIEEGVTGFSVDSRDSKSLNQVLHQLLNDSATYQAMSRAAKQRLTLFSEARMQEEVWRVIQHAGNH